MFDVQERYSNGFTCVADHVTYQVLAYDHVTRQTHVWTWLSEIEKWDFETPIPDSAMRHIALELYLVFDILLDGYEYLSPSTRARARAIDHAMVAYGEGG
jgi:hypothetical protein